MDTTSQNVISETCESSKRKREASPYAEFSCVLCHELLLDPVSLNCGHNFDASCMRDLLQSEFAGPCPTCRAPLPVDPPQVRYALMRLFKAVCVFLVYFTLNE